MKGTIALLIGAIVLVFVGFASIGVARLEDRMANAQEQLATQQYDAARESLTAAQEYADDARWVPWLGRDARPEIRARVAALDYWQQRYNAVLPAQAEPVAAVDETNVDLQLVVANAAYRVRQAPHKDRQATLQALDEAASGYVTVLKSSTWHPDAAFNYEYVVRIRDQVAKGNQPPPPPQPSDNADLGESGAPAPATSLKGFQIYIPLESGERNPAGGEAGKAAPKDRKG